MDLFVSFFSLWGTDKATKTKNNKCSTFNFMQCQLFNQILTATDNIKYFY